jgi:hypothetical protein
MVIVHGEVEIGEEEHLGMVRLLSTIIGVHLVWNRVENRRNHEMERTLME